MLGGCWKQESCRPPETLRAGNPLLIPLSHAPTDQFKWLKTDVTLSQLALCVHHRLSDGLCGRRTSALASPRVHSRRGMGKEMLPGCLGT